MRKVLHGKEMNRTSRCENTIFSKYLTLPMATFPHTYIYDMYRLLYRIRPDSNRYLHPRQGSTLPIKLITLSNIYVHTKMFLIFFLEYDSHIFLYNIVLTASKLMRPFSLKRCFSNGTLKVNDRSLKKGLYLKYINILFIHYYLYLVISFV